MNGEEIINEAIDKVTQEWKELEDRRNMKNNIVMYNLEESEEDEPLRRENEDKARCCDLLKNSLKVGDFYIEKVIRLGKRNTERLDLDQY